MLRYYVDGRQKCITLAPKNDLYRSWADVEPLIERELGQLESQTKTVCGAVGLSEYIEKHYLPWLEMVLAEEHERDKKHPDRIELPE
jgi:hypothetical protein